MPSKALYRLSLDAPPAVTVVEGSVSTDVFVNLRVPDDALTISGWSVRVQASGGPGCRVTDATMDGTDAFDQFDEIQFFATRFSDDDTVIEVSAASSFVTPEFLGPTDSFTSILKLAVASDSGVASNPCRLDFVDPDQVTPTSIFNLITNDVDGSAVRPATEGLTIEA